MSKYIVLYFFILILTGCEQSHKTNRQDKLKEYYSQAVSPSNKAVLIDSITKWTYVLDTSHTYITAFNQFGDSVWVTNVYWKGDGYHKPGITSISFGQAPEWMKPVAQKGQTTIWVAFDRCGGVINLRIRKFQMIGCD